MNTEIPRFEVFSDLGRVLVLSAPGGPPPAFHAVRSGCYYYTGVTAKYFVDWKSGVWIFEHAQNPSSAPSTYCISSWLGFQHQLQAIEGQGHIWNLDPVDKFSCFGIYQGYPWYILVL